MNNLTVVCCTTLMALGSLNAQQPIAQDSLAVQQLDEVVVSDSRFELKREHSGKTVIRIEREALEKFSGNSLATLLNTKSGLEISGSRGRQGEVLGVYARGGRGRQVLVLIDGVRVSDPSSSSQEYDLRLLSPDRVESVEIIKGAASTLYGTNAATAVISITTRKPEGSKFRISAGSSMGTNQAEDEQDYNLSAFSNHANLAGQVGGFDYSLGIAQQFTDNLSSLDTPGREEDPFSRYAADVRLGYRFTPGIRFTVFANQSYFNSAYDESFGFSDAPYKYVTLQKRAGSQFHARYGKGEFQLLGSFAEFHSENFSAFPGTFRGKSQSLEAIHKYSFGESVYSLLGLSYLRDQATFGEPRDFALLDPYLNLVYVSDFGLNLNVGTRLNTHSEYGNQWVYNFNPSFIFPQTDGYFKIMGSWATSYITPSLTQLFGEFGANPDLQPENDRTLETGIEWSDEKGLRASLLYFNRREKNFVYFDNTEFLYRNSPSTINAQGLEAELFWFPFETGRVEANYTFTERKGDNAIRIPKHKVNAEFGLDLSPDTYAALRYSYTGSRPDTDFNTFAQVTLEAFSLYNLYFSREVLSGKMKLFLNAENLLNTRYYEVQGFLTRGRNFRIGFILEL